MRIHPKYLKIAGIVFISLIVLLSVASVIAYNKREIILNAAIEKAIKKAKADYGLNVKIGSAGFDGLRTVVINDLSIIPDNRDSLAFIKNMRVGVKLLPLIFGHVKLAELTIHSGKINLVKKDSLSNYDFLFRKKQEQETSDKSKINLAELANNLLNKMLNKIPDDMDIRNFDLWFTDENDKLKFSIPIATINTGNLKSTIYVNNKESVWHAQGKVDPENKQFDLSFFADGQKVALPFLEQKYKLKLNFDTAHAKLLSADLDGDELKIAGTYSIRNLLINHPKIAANNIIIPNGSIDANIFIGENYVSVDSSSVIHLQKIEANPYLKYTLGKHKIYELKLHTNYIDAQDLFNAFPAGLFESLEGMKVAGKLQYDLNFYLNSANPDNVKFDSRFNKKGFKILKWGKVNLQKINNTFVYTPYEYGKPMRDIVIGPQNPNYTPLDKVSAELKYALMTAEDPSFFSHGGFVQESIRKSIATNFKEKAFKRGGSTISMQLVKNVYLNRQKTLARKIEEILIVWLIENNKLITKARMLETYLNLIEWGNNVYGIGEASRYYFDKHPSDLTLGEGIFLASIVPRPKKGLYFFEPDGSLRQGLHGYFRLIGGLMAKKGLIAPDSGAYGFYSVRLKEALRQQAAYPDSAITDSLLMQEDEEDTQSFLEKIFSGKKDKAPDSIRVDDIGKLKKQDTVKTQRETAKDRRERRRKEREIRRNDGL